MRGNKKEYEGREVTGQCERDEFLSSDIKLLHRALLHNIIALLKHPSSSLSHSLQLQALWIQRVREVFENEASFFLWPLSGGGESGS